MKSVSVAGLNVTAATKIEVIEEIQNRLETGERTVVVTPYSEFLYAALKDRKVMELLNTADISIADGIGMLWAATFLQLPAKKDYLTLWLQAIASGLKILWNPQSIKNIIPEKIVGADFFWDLARIAHERQLSIFLLGGFGDTAKTVAEKLSTKFPGLRIAGTSNKNWNDPTLVQDVQAAAPDFLFVALGPIKQEAWVMDNIDALPSVKIAIGLGGTFDYVAGTRKAPPAFIRTIGLEWLYRLITQPQRFIRIFNATFGLVHELVKYRLSNQ